MSLPTSGLSSLLGGGRAAPMPGSPLPPPALDALRGDGSLRGMVVNAASEKLGKIYKWGGKGGPADGGRVDCSGLTGWAYKRIGIDIGPDTFTQITKGVQIPPSQIKPGDLIFCNFGSQGGNPGPGHVVMATGYGAGSRIIEASQSGKPVAFGSMPTGRIVVKRILP
jgi:cell wall-associated NlpC family hydrolase